jgi:hypothetical protein
VQTPDGSLQPDNYWRGNAALRYSDFRSLPTTSWNISVDRTFRPKESIEVRFAAEMTNAFNQVSFRPTLVRNLGATNASAISSLGIQPGQGLSGDFGTFGTDTFDPRQVQLELRVRF